MMAKSKQQISLLGVSIRIITEGTFDDEIDYEDLIEEESISMYQSALQVARYDNERLRQENEKLRQEVEDLKKQAKKTQRKLK
jgi:hypothetical protein